MEVKCFVNTSLVESKAINLIWYMNEVFKIKKIRKTFRGLNFGILRPHLVLETFSELWPYLCAAFWPRYNSKSRKKSSRWCSYCITRWSKNWAYPTESTAVRIHRPYTRFCSLGIPFGFVRTLPRPNRTHRIIIASLNIIIYTCVAYDC